MGILNRIPFATIAPTPVGSVYGYFVAGNNTTVIDQIDKTLVVGNAAPSGNTTVNLGDAQQGEIKSSTHSFTGGGHTLLNPLNLISYFQNTIPVVGLTANKGTLTVARYLLAGVHGLTHGFYGGGRWAGGRSNVIDYIDLTTVVAAALNRGVLLANNEAIWGCFGSQWGFFCGGREAANVTDKIQYIDMNIFVGNALNRGILTLARSHATGVSGPVYGFSVGGKNIFGARLNTIDKFDTTTGAGAGATPKGTLVVAKNGLGGVSGSTYAFFGGGDEIGIPTDHIEGLNIITATSNAFNRGILTLARFGASGG